LVITPKIIVSETNNESLFFYRQRKTKETKEMTSTDNSTVHLVYEECKNCMCRLIFSVKETLIRVSVQKYQISFMSQSLFELKQLLTKQQYESLMDQIYSFIFELK
jgi:hypothetical protein